MIPILIDPWLIRFSSDDSYANMKIKMESLQRIFNDLSNQYPLEIVPFISPELLGRFWDEFDSYKFVADKRDIVRYIYRLSTDDEPQNAPATIIDTTCPQSELPPTWLTTLTLKGNNDNPPAWRFPMLFMPQFRRSFWPEMEINYIPHGSTENKTRNIVTIEVHQDHRYFMPDIDPWRLGCVGEPRPNSSVDERRQTCRRLPRPRSLPLTIPLSQLAEETRRITDCTCGTATDYYYLPPLSWRPTNRGKSDWRNSAFVRDGVVLRERRGRETGFRDRAGHIWVWDDEEAYHWEVKTENDIRVAKVRFDGLKLRS